MGGQAATGMEKGGSAYARHTVRHVGTRGAAPDEAGGYKHV